MSKFMIDSLQRAFTYLKSHKVECGIGREVDNSDFHIESVNLIGTNVDAPVGAVFFVAMYSALRKRSVKASTVVPGDMTIQGNLKPFNSVQEFMQVGMDYGATKACIPMENKRQYLELPADIVEKIDSIFYTELMVAAQKCLE
ncbi:hypothetical protein JW998_13275 [candidate division KSB1 bacterium]|nr:hypothetical protein [candidate division KSB1 bacterium]